ncbi:MAG: NUDIX domain-containing protein [Pirellulales bacterium]|nr:NUDIX domain-containing protein [Pirellulales bacterium]
MPDKPKPAKVSSGILLYRRVTDQLEVLLVHPSGNYNRHKPWSIPKGLPDEGESVEAAARRETLEEAGVDVTGPLVELGTIRYQKSGKLIHCFGAAAPDDCAPHCASWEVDRAEFVSLAEAQRLIHPDQRPFLDRLVEHIALG